MEAGEEELRQIVQRYRKQLLEKEAEINKQATSQPSRPISSREYSVFRKEVLTGRLSVYETLCGIAERTLALRPEVTKEQALAQNIRISHLDVTPTGAFSLTVLAPIVIIGIGGMISLVVFHSFSLMFFFLMLGLIAMVILDRLLEYVANNWRLSASNQMVICIFYVATYMRHTSNIENALEFAADHISPPLALDLKKVLWDVETQSYESVKESLDSYLETWRQWNMEFIESFHLIEASLYEPSEDRRLSLIDKALEVMLQETYDKMLHYAHDLKNPITMLHMLGVILPILTMVILPLVVSFMQGVQWYHLAMLYNFLLPVGVYLLGKSILSERPTGYGDTDVSEDNPEIKKYRNVLFKIGGMDVKVNPLFVACLIGGVMLLIGLTPVILHAISPTFDLPSPSEEMNKAGSMGFSLLDYHASKAPGGGIIGPFGMGATLLSLFVPLSFGLGISVYYSIRSGNVIKLRHEAKELEKEFASGLFQLGNRIGDGIPVEMAFGKVADVMQGTRSSDFFQIVNNNITKLGMSAMDAIFNERNGALVYFPSKVIESSMKVLIQSSQKGPLVCSQAIINVSQYIKEIHRVDERLKDLLADIISSMKSQISFLAPAIAGIVVGISAMITTIIAQLGKQMNSLSADVPQGVGSGVTDMFGDGIPPYFLQIVVGIYIVQIVYILTVMTNGIENGSDSLAEEDMLGRNMRNSVLLYVVITAVVTIAFNLVAAQILSVNLTS